ncbi:MAG: hypothetical protein R3B72_48270 [Polyangiaceae bacterium]
MVTASVACLGAQCDGPRAPVGLHEPPPEPLVEATSRRFQEVVVRRVSSAYPWRVRRVSAIERGAREEAIAARTGVGWRVEISPYGGLRRLELDPTEIRGKDVEGLWLGALEALEVAMLEPAFVEPPGPEAVVVERMIAGEVDTTGFHVGVVPEDPLDAFVATCAVSRPTMTVVVDAALRAADCSYYCQQREAVGMACDRPRYEGCVASRRAAELATQDYLAASPHRVEIVVPWQDEVIASETADPDVVILRAVARPRLPEGTSSLLPVALRHHHAHLDLRVSWPAESREPWQLFDRVTGEWLDDGGARLGGEGGRRGSRLGDGGLAHRARRARRAPGRRRPPPGP